MQGNPLLKVTQTLQPKFLQVVFFVVTFCHSGHDYMWGVGSSVLKFYIIKLKNATHGHAHMINSNIIKHGFNTVVDSTVF